MSRGAVLDEAFIRSFGLADQRLTLSGAIENRNHPQGLQLGDAPDQRFRLFRLLRVIEVEENGSARPVRVIGALGPATGDAVAATLQPRSSREFARALGAVRECLLSAKRPGDG